MTHFYSSDWAGLDSSTSDAFRAHYRMTFVDAEGEVVVNEIRSTSSKTPPGIRHTLELLCAGLGGVLISLQVLHYWGTELGIEDQQQQSQGEARIRLVR